MILYNGIEPFYVDSHDSKRLDYTRCADVSGAKLDKC